MAHARETRRMCRKESAQAPVNLEIQITRRADMNFSPSTHQNAVLSADQGCSYKTILEQKRRFRSRTHSELPLASSLKSFVLHI